MSRLFLTALLALSGLLSVTPAIAQTSTRDEIRLIEQEYARQSNGQAISDQQLEYYLEQKGKLVENMKAKLWEPIVLSHLCTKHGIHFC